MSDSFIPLCVPEIRGNEWTYVKDCLDTGWVSSVGSYVDRFEQMVAGAAGAKFCVAAVNGTSALHISLLLAGVQPDDEVLVSTLTFIAPANAIRYVGAWPVFVDAESDYWQLSPQLVADFLENGCERRDGSLFNKLTGRRVSAIMPVHVLGHPAPMRELEPLARKFGLAIIGDATESLGASLDGKPLAQWSDVACFSFNGNKLLTTGGGGVIVTDNEAWAKRAKYLTTQAKDDPVEYIHHEIGYNHRLTNLQAAMGVAQMEQLDDYIATKRRIAARYAEAFASVEGIEPMREAPGAFSVFWMYTVLLDEARFGLGWRALLAKLHAQKIQTRPLWQPLHLSRAHAGSQVLGGEVATRLYETALSLPCSVGLKPEDQERVIAAVLGPMKAALDAYLRGGFAATFTTAQPQWIDLAVELATEARELIFSDVLRKYPAITNDDDGEAQLAAILDTDVTIVAPLLYRLSHALFRRDPQHPALRYYAHFMRVRTAMEIYYSAEIGPRLRVMHGAGLVLGPRHRIGSDFTVYQGVTLGQRRNDCPHESLIIGDRCTFFAGSVALGELTIGDDVKLAANAVLLHHADAGGTYAGAPATRVR